MNSICPTDVSVRGIFLTGCASLWLAWGADGAAALAGFVALALAATVAATTGRRPLAGIALPEAAGGLAATYPLLMQAVPVPEAPGFGHLTGERGAVSTRPVGSSAGVPGNLVPDYVVNVSRSAEPQRWTSLLGAPVELLAVSWGVPVAMLLVVVPIGLALALMVRIAGWLF